MPARLPVAAGVTCRRAGAGSTELTVVFLGWGRGRSLSDRSALTEEREESTESRERAESTNKRDINHITHKDA